VICYIISNEDEKESNEPDYDEHQDQLEVEEIKATSVLPNSKIPRPDAKSFKHHHNDKRLP
jgi:hypothetical protein